MTENSSPPESSADMPTPFLADQPASLVVVNDAASGIVGSERPPAPTGKPTSAYPACPEQETSHPHRPDPAAIPQRADELRRSQFWESEGVPAWLVSLVFHTSLLILLMLFTLPPGGEKGIVIVGRSGDPTESVEPFVELEVLVDPVESTEADSAAEATVVAAAIEAARATAAAATSVQPLEFAPALDPQPPGATDSEAEKIQQSGKELAAFLDASVSVSAEEMRVRLPTGGIAPRNPQSRAQLGQLYGATAESENAVELALAWLAEHQQRDGSWTFDLTVDPCRGRCSHSRIAGDNATPPTAATGLTLLAFLGAGYTHREGKYAEVVRRGVYYLRDEARRATFGLDLQAGSMYGHGIATLALTEILAIDRYNNQVDEDLKELVEGAVLFTLVAQHEQGGWRYVPGSPGDMTVSGWQILSLISAKYGGVPLRTDTLPKAKQFIKSLSAEGSFEFGYVSTRPQPTTTAIGMCMLMYLGESPFATPFSMALSRMASRGPKKFDLYHDYYATIALHNARHPSWEMWHKPLRDHLVRTQATTGHERGSWHFKDHHGDVGGRLYSTAMATMILEVYYRHLPLYQNRDEF